MISIVGSSVSGVLAAIRGINLGVGGCMIALAVAQIISSGDVFDVMADALAVVYTMYVELVLLALVLLSLGLICVAFCACSLPVSLRCF